ncbi:MAG: energy transducer TonB [Gilvibacter sp.]
MEVKKSPKANLNGWSNIFFLAGLALMLFISWRAMEWQSTEKQEISIEDLALQSEFEDEIPITEVADMPPPPPPPPVVQQVIEIVEDDLDIEETVIESTETDQNEAIEDVVDVDEIEEIEDEEVESIPFAVIEDVPIYPGCENLSSKADKKQCLSDRVMKFVQKNFDTELASELGLEGRQRISVQFKIDKHGNVIDVRARAPHPRLEKEAIAVVGSLPQMIPGKQRGKPVGVLYSLPILFQVETN